MLRHLLSTLAVAAAMLGPTVAWAHAALLETAPADGAVLEAAPAELRLVFNEPMRPIFLSLIDGAGRQLLPADAVRMQNAAVVAAVPSLPAGAYIVSWRVVSADGHPIGGAFTFRVGAAADAAAAADTTPDTEAGWRIASGVARFLVYGLTLLAAGGALFAALVLYGAALPRAVRIYVFVSAAGAALALVLSLGIEGGLLALGPWTAILDPAVWRLGASGPAGISVAVSLLGLALIVIGLSGRAIGWSLLIPVGALVAIAGFGLTGHAATAAPRWLTAPAVVLHGLVAAFWIGAFWPLAWMLRRAPRPAATAAVHRFSRLAVGAVALLVLAGLALAVVQLESVVALWQTAYGLVLLAKLGAVLVLLALAGLNRWRLSPVLAGGGTPAAARLRRSVQAEMVLAVAVIAATAALGTVPPPRALAERATHADDHAAGTVEQGYSVVVPASPYTAFIEISPARPGGNTITVRLMHSGDGAPVDPLEATIAFALPAAGIEPITRPLERAGPGVFRFTGSALSLPGRWTLRVEVLVTDFEKAIFETDIPIR